MAAGRKGFVFTVDAFIALFLVLLTVYALILLLNVPKPFLAQFEQTYDLARDSLDSLDRLQMSEVWAGPAKPVLDGFVFADYLSERDKSHSVLETLARLLANDDVPQAQYLLQNTTSPVIPPQYGYRLEFFDKRTGAWKVVTGRDKPVEKLQASASRIVMVYERFDDPGASPFSYNTCHGDAIPCEAKNFTGFTKGSITGPIEIRMVVWV